MKIGIVILNWNGVDLLNRFLPSVVECSSGHDIYVADNASTDSSRKWIQDHYPTVQIIAMNKNRGYAGGYNEALKHVKNEVVCLLNSDVEVTPEWLTPIVKRFQGELKLAVLQPKLLDLKRPEYFEYAGAAGGFLDRLAYPYCRGRIFTTLEKDQGQYDDAIDLDWASGACFFIRKTVFDELRGFDVDYFAHQEEIDLCWRVRKIGYRVGYEPKSSILHLGGGTLKNHNPKKTFYNFRNSLYNIVKNDESNLMLAILLLRMVLDGVAALKFLIEGNGSHFIAVIKAHISFYSNLSIIWPKRNSRSKIIYQNNQRVFSIIYQYFVLNRRTFHKTSGTS
ncbi:dTDP-Rha--alpha-D-GlcNAc-pyrophosphate polyprenol alpha-3-L-rhamnosyltransferase [Nonlabens spongiae]|uniref:dTDP-Rha--alpha-D-GlcNAc-pyrophosphate polyprenol alpha-3-L-rhamnosyltransferase n=1 Tax=Nonlabens spongiae TaxID=331648 RepID=A0A1W6MJE8_9FLAO|nr:glycosyltransferase family 2 protein [Nonlabens spongiae]ARN77738.1 dTDP-Rha--alpha-D-GlcNAc-pyrophosphate polyprenol alpha-3-L-rhamnosyltransferase [Nonlabens spongiae]